ncbi:hypothetical protein D3C76_1724860 [compost metagenome]
MSQEVITVGEVPRLRGHQGGVGDHVAILVQQQQVAFETCGAGAIEQHQVTDLCRHLLQVVTLGGGNQALQ